MDVGQDGEQIVTGQPVPAHEPAKTATEREAGDAGSAAPARWQVSPSLILCSMFSSRTRRGGGTS
jgi:hypothetical protein